MVSWAGETRTIDMHVHACMIKIMRTTIEIDDDKLVKLKKLAAERGARGFSGLVNEALERYLDEGSDGELREGRVKRILALSGAWSDEAAEEARSRIAELRKTWR